MGQYSAHIAAAEGDDAEYVATSLAFPRICDQEMRVIRQLKSSGAVTVKIALVECQGVLHGLLMQGEAWE